MKDNSTLNMINVEIAQLKEKQKERSLDIVEMKKLESLIRMKKDLVTTPALIDNSVDVDEDIFTDEEILEFLANRKANEESKSKKKTKRTAVKKKKKTNKKTKKKVSKG